MMPAEGSHACRRLIAVANVTSGVFAPQIFDPFTPRFCSYSVSPRPVSLAGSIAVLPCYASVSC